MDLAGSIDPKQRAEPWNARFAYPAQRYFIEYLKRERGEDVFAKYLRQAITRPDRTSLLFEEIYLSSLSSAIAAYQREVRSGAWPPKE